MTNVYALYVAPDVPPDVITFLGGALTTSERLTGWWNHLPGLYLLESDSDASIISKMVAKILKPWSFLVMRVDIEDLQGWMPERGWSWLRSRHAAQQETAQTKAFAV